MASANAQMEETMVTLMDTQARTNGILYQILEEQKKSHDEPTESQTSQALQKLASANAQMEKMMVQLNKNCERTNDLLHEILQDQKKSHYETWQSQRDVKMMLWCI